MKTALGIDLGTTKAAAVLLDEAGTLLGVANAAHHADIPSVPGGAEQDPAKILEAVARIIAALPQDQLGRISCIGVTGQMHSVLLGNGNTVSPLVTWQDHRCGAERLKRFQTETGLPLREGFGGTTLARLAEEKQLGSWNFAATINDYLVYVLTGNKHVVTDPTHAASWGLYRDGGWNLKALEALHVPASVLPEIRPCGAVAGTVCAEAARRFGISEGVPVANAIGDNQASILSCGGDFAHEIYLTLGTGAQLSMVVDKPPAELPDSLEPRPFPGGRSLLVSAPLCGGAAFAWLADTVNAFRRDLGEAELPKGALLDRLDALALAELERGEPDLTIAPHFLGERWNPDLRGSCCGLTLANATPGKTGAALALGIVRNLKSGFCAEVLADRRSIIGSGNAVRLLKSVQFAIQREFGLPLRLTETREEAAVGAALLALGK